ncbi:aminotransferase [Alicyclobacillus sp.]|uniref:aminotransferase n=1 Tax=Alicyclobacillus sp. TaxID=61169 RepID=UPI0025C38FAC|nr:aminotransferase [Alicyclobacillus sp.]MCL6517594.1 aminotransferase class III-fold pyridoxal phosphate-dependent enzyme [Alicyclobacillus sp.]
MTEAEGRIAKEEIYQRDRRHVWHAFAPYSEQNPWVVEEAEGVHVVDLEGRRYLDAMAGLWCVNAGYGQERLARAGYEQMRRMPYYPLSAAHTPAALLADRLSGWLGADYRVFFNNSGSEANETAFKLARQYHAQTGQPGRYKIIARYRAYHGSTLGALAATGQQQRKYLYEPLAPGFLHIPAPDLYRRPDGLDPIQYGKQCAQQLEQVIVWEGPETVAAFIMEPVITGGGVILPPPNYLDEVAAVCRRHGVLLIVDEVICGFGRTGKNFGFQHSRVQPDIVTMAKGITSAYAPLSATAVRQDLYDAFKDPSDPYGYFRQVNTFGGHPVSCAVALENLSLMEELELVPRAARMGDVLAQALERLYRHPNVGDVRVHGLLAGIELVANREEKTPLEADLVKRVIAACKARGLIVGRNGDTVAGFNNVITLAPPLIIEEPEIAFIAETLDEAMQEVLGGR